MLFFCSRSFRLIRPIQFERSQFQANRGDQSASFCTRPDITILLKPETKGRVIAGRSGLLRNIDKRVSD